MATKNKTIPAPESVPAHLTADSLKFLRALGRHNDREWFQPRKAEFESLLRQPMLAVIRKVTEAMAGFAPEHMRPAEKCLFRIYRDTRFSNDKSPYKTHVAAWWARQGMEKTSGAGYYLHVTAKDVLFATGIYMPDKDQLRQIRLWLLDHHAEFRKIYNRAALRRALPDEENNALTRPPKGFPADHPAIDLIRGRQWGLSVTLGSEAALDPKFAQTIARHFRLAAPLVDALNAPLVSALKPKRKVLFGLR
jgi:uncharacterized protein (TIGR02453 family)